MVENPTNPQFEFYSQQRWGRALKARSQGLGMEVYDCAKRNFLGNLRKS
jgi:hypothetical protein